MFLRGLCRFRRIVDLIFLTGVLLATRIAFRSHYLYDIDSVNFALGLRRFSPGEHQPHPPGYFLYIQLGRLVNMLFQDANAALVSISIAASCGALLMIYALADHWFGRRAAAFAGLIFVFSPLVWFHGTVALTYAVEAFFSTLVGYLCWRIYRGEGKFVFYAAVIAGLAAGFRPSFLLFLLPLMLFSVAFGPVKVSRGRILAAAAVLGLIVMAWFIPMVWQSGGLNAYWSSLLSLWRIAPSKQTVFNSSVANTVARLFAIGGIYILCFGFAALLAFRKGRHEEEAAGGRTIFMWMWIGPGLLFFTLIFLKFVNSGYLLVISPPVFAWLGLKASNWYEDLPFRKAGKIISVGGFVTFNSLIFLFAPVYCSYAGVRHFEAELESVLRSVPAVASPADTMIVGFDSHFLGYRHAGYYLPGWFTAQFPEVRLVSGPRVFAMEHGDTRLVSELPVDRFKYFLFFPLPSDDSEYGDYMNRVRTRFQNNALRTIVAEGREFTIGAVRDLPLLFPVAAPDLYPVGDVLRRPVNVR